MMLSKRNLLFQGAIFRFHVKLWEGIIEPKNCPSRKKRKYLPYLHVVPGNFHHPDQTAGWELPQMVVNMYQESPQNAVNSRNYSTLPRFLGCNGPIAFMGLVYLLTNFPEKKSTIHESVNIPFRPMDIPMGFSKPELWPQNSSRIVKSIRKPPQIAVNSTGMSMEVIVTSYSKLVYNLFRGRKQPTYIGVSQNPFTSSTSRTPQVGITNSLS